MLDAAVTRPQLQSSLSAPFTDRHAAEIDDHIDRSNPHDRSDPSPSQTGD